MAELAPGSQAMLRGSQEERKVKRQRLDELDGLTACRPLVVRGLDGSELQVPLDDNMTMEDVRQSVAGRIGLRTGSMFILAAGANTLDDSKPLLEQVHGDVITYVVQQVALAMFIFAFFFCMQGGPIFSGGLRGQPRLVEGMQQLRFCNPVTANA